MIKSIIKCDCDDVFFPISSDASAVTDNSEGSDDSTDTDNSEAPSQEEPLVKSFHALALEEEQEEIDNLTFPKT